MPTRALIFDFDGLILDTETTEWRAWKTVFDEHDAPLTLEEWLPTIGTASAFDPKRELAARSPRPVDVRAAHERVRELRDGFISAERALPGVEAMLDSADELGLACGVASSSTRVWVSKHLAMLGLAHRFQALACREDVATTKPAPDLYVRALGSLGVGATEALAFEDSLNGVRAAKAAGMRCVAVPNDMTASMDLSEADLILPSLASMSLEGLLGRIDGRSVGSS